jgi:hypothetical protein
MDRGIHAAAAGLARGSAWAGHAASATPVWATLVIAALLVAPVFFGLAIAVVSLRRPWHDSDDDRGPGPGGGGGGPPRPRSPGGGPSGAEPAWWSDFERQFGAYVARSPTPRRRAREAVPLG